MDGHADALHKLSTDVVNERQDRAEAERRSAERYDQYYRPYDAVWLDLISTPCNPLAGEPLSPSWLKERLTTLADRALSLDAFDGGTATVDWLRWLPQCEVANKNRIAKALSLTLAVALDGELSETDTAAFCDMLESHPGNEIQALRRADQPTPPKKAAELLQQHKQRRQEEESNRRQASDEALAHHEQFELPWKDAWESLDAAVKLLFGSPGDATGVQDFASSVRRIVALARDTEYERLIRKATKRCQVLAEKDPTGKAFKNVHLPDNAAILTILHEAFENDSAIESLAVDLHVGSPFVGESTRTEVEWADNLGTPNQGDNKPNNVESSASPPPPTDKSTSTETISRFAPQNISENDLHRTREKCEGLVNYISTACLILDNCLKSIDPDDPLKQYPTIESAAKKWMECIKGTFKYWPCVRENVGLLIERANHGQQTSVELHLDKDYVEFCPTTHAAAEALGDFFVNVFNYTDLDTAIRCLRDLKYHKRHWEHLKAITYPNVPWYKTRLSHEWRNACNWLETHPFSSPQLEENTNGDFANKTLPALTSPPPPKGDVQNTISLIQEWFSLYEKLLRDVTEKGTAVASWLMERNAYLDRFRNLCGELGRRGEQLGIDASALFRFQASVQTINEEGQVLYDNAELLDDIHALVKRIEARSVAPPKASKQSSAIKQLEKTTPNPESSQLANQLTSNGFAGLRALLLHFQTFNHPAIHAQKFHEGIRSESGDALATVAELERLGVIKGKQDSHQLAMVYRFDAEQVKAILATLPAMTSAEPVTPATKLTSNSSDNAKPEVEDDARKLTIEQLDQNTPELNTQDSKTWALASSLKSHGETPSTKSLREQRSAGMKIDGKFGICTVGRIWRKDGRNIWYYIPSLLPNRNQE